MSTFTPGHWIFDGEAYIFAEPMSEGKMIAEMRGWGWLQYKGEEAAIAEQESNARLISAAPDMYEALKAFVDDWTELNGKVRGSTLNKIDAAIAKAEGCHD